jgi:hypothetical protein
MFLIENMGRKDKYFFINIGYAYNMRSQLETFNTIFTPNPIIN